MRRSLPFALRGIDSDSGSEFINFHCYDWCKEHELQFTRGRPYHKNDDAHIEQKNWTHVRKIFGWKRITATQAIERMNDLYRTELRLMLNYFQPSVKLIERLIELDVLSAEQVAAMRAERDAVDPIALAAAIEARWPQRYGSAARRRRNAVRLRAIATLSRSSTPAELPGMQLKAATPVRSNAAR